MVKIWVRVMVKIWVRVLVKIWVRILVKIWVRACRNIVRQPLLCSSKCLFQTNKNSSIE